MSYRFWIILFASTAFLTPIRGQQLATGYVDPMTVIRTVSETMGVDKVRCLTFSGVGYAGKVGPSYQAGVW